MPEVGRGGTAKGSAVFSILLFGTENTAMLVYAPMTLLELSAICADNQLIVDEFAQTKLHDYSILLASWNSRINLISRKDEENIFSRHILHSLTLRMPAICNYDFSYKRVADVGTGGGLPGIPLKIVTPSLDMTLIDSVQKKITACNDMIMSLGLGGSRAIAGRAEELARLPEQSHQYDVIISRAVASLEDLTKWTYGLLKPAGTLFSLKGGDLTEEIKRTQRLKFVSSVRETSLLLAKYDDLAKEDKKLVRVDLV